MSFGEDPFHKFSGFDPESKLSEFRKRFEDLKQSNRSNMLFDNRRTNGWPLHRRPDFYSMAKNAHFNNDSKSEEDAIPIKVIHETSNERPVQNEDLNEHNSDSISSSGSQSHKSSANSSSSSGSVFHSNEPQSQTHESAAEPRVHHIPIKVEPRDGSTSSGYTSEPAVNTVEQPLSRSSSNSSRHSVQSAGSRSSGIARSPSPAKSVSSSHSNISSNSSNSPKVRVHQIPIVVEGNDTQKSPFNVNSIPKVKTNGLGQSRTKGNKANSGPFVTRIPVVGESNSSPEPQTSSPEPPPVQKTVKPDPLEIINKILNDLHNYEIEVNQFNGTPEDKKYRYLDEMLTRCMIKLDTIETEGKEEVRKARKAAIIAVNKCITLLESKVKTEDNHTNQTCSEEQMDTSTPEPTEKNKTTKETKAAEETVANEGVNNKEVENVKQNEEQVESMQVDQTVDNSQENVKNNENATHNQTSVDVENKDQRTTGDRRCKETAV